MPMRVYVVERQDGDYENRSRSVTWAGTNKRIAYKKAKEQCAEENFFSIWENGVQISEYYRTSSRSEGEITFGKWDRESGAVNPTLER